LESPAHVLRVFVTSISVSGCEKVKCGPHEIWFIVLLPSENQGLKCPVTINIINNQIIFSFDMSVYSVWLSNNWRKGAKSLLKKANSYSVIREIFHFSRNLTLPFSVHRNDPTELILMHTSPVHTVTHYFLKIRFNIILPSTTRLIRWFLEFIFSE
jgi:hypothetical protein